MMDSGKDHCELTEENLDFLLRMVDCCGSDDNENDISMTMDVDGGDEEGDDDVFENVLINSYNFHQNKQSASDIIDSSSNMLTVLSDVGRTNENKENNDDHVSTEVDRNNNNSGINMLSNLDVYNTVDSNVNTSSTSFLNDEMMKNSPYSENDNNNNNSNSNNNNNSIDWSSFGDFDFSNNALLLNNDSSTKTNSKSHSSSSSNNKNNNGSKDLTPPSFRLSQRTNSSSSGSSNSRNASSSSNPDVCSGSSRNSSCSSYCGVSSSTTTNSTTTTTTSRGSTSSSSSDVMTAYMEACRSGQLTPILKEELKFFIQARRLSQGKEEMEVQFLPPSPSQLSAKELEKIDRRKKQNRQAAKRFRQKQKSCEELLLQRIKELESVHATLFQEAQALRVEKQKLMEVMAEHLLVCPLFSQSAQNVV